MPFVPCKENQYRDPKTNRCRNKDGYKRDRTPTVLSHADTDPTTVTKEKFKPCKEHQYRDPKTNRCRNKEPYKGDRTPTVTHDSGTDPRSDPVTTPKEKFKPCKEHQYRDPKTNRCRNRGGQKDERRKPSKPTKVLGEGRDPTSPKWVHIPGEVEDCIKRSKLPLRDEQIKVIHYMDGHDGLLVMHSTGTGKTLTAITASQCYIDKNPHSKVVFIGPASLTDNFRKEMVNYGLSIADMSKYEMYSFDKFYLDIKNGNPTTNLTNKMLIIDEAHNLRNPSSVKSQAIVDASALASKRILLTATPFVNNLIDFVPLINIIYGRKIVGTQQQFLEGITPEYLSKKTTDENLTTLRYLLKDKIDVLSLPKTRDYPERVEIKQFVPMSMEYYEAYNRLISGEQVLGMIFTNPDKFYHAYRRAVNQAGTDYYSSKIQAGINIFQKGKALIYTNWVDFGLIPISSKLKKLGITYRLFYGETPIHERQQIVDDFNADKFQVLVVSKAGGEGLDLKGVRSVVVMDPTWNDAGLQQVIGRAIRYKSHVHLPEEEQKVHVYFMILSIPVELQKEKGDDEKAISGDHILYNIISDKNAVNSSVKVILEDISI